VNLTESITSTPRCDYNATTPLGVGGLSSTSFPCSGSGAYRHGFSEHLEPNPVVRTRWRIIDPTSPQSAPIERDLAASDTNASAVFDSLFVSYSVEAYSGPTARDTHEEFDLLLLGLATPSLKWSSLARAIVAHLRYVIGSMPSVARHVTCLVPLLAEELLRSEAVGGLSQTSAPTTLRTKLAALATPGISIHLAEDLVETIAEFCLSHDEAEWAEELAESLLGKWPRHILVMLLDSLVALGVESHSTALHAALKELLQHTERTVFLSALYLLLHGMGLTQHEARQLRTEIPEVRRALFDACWSRLEEEELLPAG